MRNCFVPLCDGKNKHNAKRMMFQAPKDNDLFEKWKAVLPKKREFRVCFTNSATNSYSFHLNPCYILFQKSDKVCEQHFHEGDIELTWDHTINGEVVQMSRDKPRLKKHAIPDRNFPSDATMQALNHGSRPYTRKKPRIKQASGEPEKPPQTDPPPSEVHQSSDSLLVEMIDEADLEAKVNGAEAEAGADEASSSDFDTLFDDIFEVVLPSTLWGFHRDPDRQFIAFSEFNLSCMAVQKTVMIDAKSQYQFCSKANGLRRGSVKSCDPEEISRLLAEFDEYDESAKGESEKKKCLTD
jgi:THAP domain